MQTINMSIEGLGIVFHSKDVLKKYDGGYNFLENEFWQPEDVSRHIKEGDIVGVGTGSPGDYRLHFLEGYPNEKMLEKCPIQVRIAIRIDSETLYIRDLYDLLQWDTECKNAKSIKWSNGVYHMTIITGIPENGVCGVNQEIFVYLNKLDEMPQLQWNGVPMLEGGLYD